MVDFGKLLGNEKPTKLSNPLEIFNNLDKESGKEYIRRPQESVLQEWYKNSRDKKDIIIKLHTGQGKTVIGLLILQSYLNDGKGPVIYLCPNSYLVAQTVAQARQFGIKTVQFSDSQPPRDFLNSNTILVATCNRIFNGRSVFGVSGSKREPIHIGAIVVDDAHKCLDIIRESFSVIAKRYDLRGNANPIYSSLWSLFGESLKRQAPGTWTDINDEVDCTLAVPFWTWYDKRDEVLRILAENKEHEDLVFVWDLLKDRLDQSICIFSGGRVEISPRLLPIEMFPSFASADRRIFLSATLNEDAFLVRDLGIEQDSVLNPLSSGDVKYSGERLIILPSLVDPGLTRERTVSWITSLASKHGDFGVVAITPSSGQANYWKGAGAEVSKVQDMSTSIENLKLNVKLNDAKRVLVLVNEYDGVDLPDSTCRILCLDSLPSYNTLTDRYLQEMRPTSGDTRRRLAQRVEQGMGRGIRGINDWCIVVVAGNNLTDFLSEHSKREFLSKEAQKQIRIAETLVAQLKSEGGSLNAMENLVNQVLSRDERWKEYYRKEMNEVGTEQVRKSQLDRALVERNAERLFQQGHYAKAVETLRTLFEKADILDKGWFLQQIATYLYPIDRTSSMNTQLKAHTENPRLFRPETGISYSRLETGGTGLRGYSSG